MYKTILFANAKGGTGKSTICTFFANDMTSKEIPVAVVDADIQQSIVQLRDSELKAKGIDKEQAPWDLLWLDTTDIRNVKYIISKLQNIKAHILIDTPGNLSDKNLTPIYQAADLVVCPFSYVPIELDTTLRFAKAVQAINPDARLIFMPNNIDQRKTEYERARERDKGFELQHNFRRSWLTKEIPRRKCLERVSTLEYTSDQADLLAEAFGGIYKWLK